MRWCSPEDALRSDSATYLLHHKRQRPGEDVHEIRQVIGVLTEVELQDVQRVVIEFQHSALIVVHIAVIGGRENRDHSRESGRGVGFVHFIAEGGLYRFAPEDETRVDHSIRI